MNAADIARAARLFVEARRTGVRMPAMPDDCRPRSAAEVNAIVDAVTAELVAHDGEAIGGWKIGFLYSPRQAPLICPLFRSRMFESPARVPLGIVPSRRIEPEIAFRLTRDLPPRSAAYDAAEVASAVVACPSLEIIDTRFDTTTRSIRQMIDNRETRFEALADHNTCGAYVTGTPRADWQRFDFAAMPMTMRTPTRTIVQTVGGHAFVDPFLPCVVLANAMRHREGLAAGMLLVTGSFCGFFEVNPDEPVTAEFEGFGTAEATFASGA